MGKAVLALSETKTDQKIYEVDPLACPKCQQSMRIIAFIGDDSTIQKILKHLELWESRSHSPPPSTVATYKERLYEDEPPPFVPA